MLPLPTQYSSPRLHPVSPLPWASVTKLVTIITTLTVGVISDSFDNNLSSLLLGWHVGGVRIEGGEEGHLVARAHQEGPGVGQEQPHPLGETRSRARAESPTR
jgi:hypothetical protein